MIKRSWVLGAAALLACAVFLGTLYQAAAKVESPPHVRYHGTLYYGENGGRAEPFHQREDLVPAGPVDVLVDGRAQRDFQTNEPEYWGGGLYVNPARQDVVFLRLGQGTQEDRLLTLYRDGL